MKTSNDIAEVLESLTKAIQELQFKLNYIGKTQLLIVQHLADKDDEFEKQFVIHSLMNKRLRKGFTDFAMERKDVPDHIKTLLMEIAMIAEEE